MIDLSSEGFKSKANLKSLAPSIFTTVPSSNVSSKYTHIPTEKIIDDMEKLGWGVVDAKEVQARTVHTRNVQKHLVVFRNPDVIINGDGGDDVYPTILLTNSHDGKNAFTFTAGLFRMICENGIVISTNEFEKLAIRHMGYTFEALQVLIKEMVEKLPLTVESMNKMVDTELSDESILKFAQECLGVRFGDDLKNIKVDMDDFIAPSREEDKGNSLWKVFNVFQEKVIDGEFNYESAGKVRKAREIKNFNQDMKVNSELFNLALAYTE